MKRSFILALVVTTVSACASVGYTPSGIKTGETKLGTVLTDSGGMTLYTFDKDPSGKSVCNGKCAESWPPVAADASAKPVGRFTVVMRGDGSHQWAFGGKPLYGWVKDKKPGDTTGDRFKEVWTAAKP